MNNGVWSSDSDTQLKSQNVLKRYVIATAILVIATKQSPKILQKDSLEGRGTGPLSGQQGPTETRLVSHIKKNARCGKGGLRWDQDTWRSLSGLAQHSPWRERKWDKHGFSGMILVIDILNGAGPFHHSIHKQELFTNALQTLMHEWIRGGVWNTFNYGLMHNYGLIFYTHFHHCAVISAVMRGQPMTSARSPTKQTRDVSYSFSEEHSLCSLCGTCTQEVHM